MTQDSHITRPTIITAYRERPITRPGQVEKVLCKFGIGPGNVHRLPKKLRKKWIEEAIPVHFVMTAEEAAAIGPSALHDDLRRAYSPTAAIHGDPLSP